MASMHQRRIRPTEYLIDKKTILIVDDEMGPRESLRMILTPAHDAIVADCAAQALEILRTRLQVAQEALDSGDQKRFREIFALNDKQ
jgi:PleD family two-component response regulator